jgi:hypothetical protein
MTFRERFLLILLGISGIGALSLIGAQTYFIEITRLDNKFIAMQKEVAQLQVQLVQSTISQTSESKNWASNRFWSDGNLPDPLFLARKIKPVLDQRGITIKEFKITASTSQSFHLKYSLEASMAAFIDAFTTLEASDDKLNVWKFATIARDEGMYAIDWEVGYVAQP